MATKILFLAAQLQPFLVSGVTELLRNYDVEIIIYCEQREENRRLEIFPGGRIRLFTYHYEPDTFFWKTIDSFSPDIVYCAGWMFRMYLGWCTSLRKSGSRTICAMDTQWKNVFRQKFWVLAAPLVMQRAFTHVWVPGKRQEEYARRLGFYGDTVLHYLYAPDTALFSKAFDTFRLSAMDAFPRRFIYAGRLEPHKITNLLLAFRSLSESERNSWRLLLIGDGSMRASPLLEHSAIDYLSAMNQKELMKIASSGGVFCLCSSAEPWGTVAQEFASAGLPLLLSREAGASEHFLEENGLLCNGNDVSDIKKRLIQFVGFPDTTLFQMGEKSYRMGISSGSATWTNEIMQLS